MSIDGMTVQIFDGEVKELKIKKDGDIEKYIIYDGKKIYMSKIKVGEKIYLSGKPSNRRYNYND